MKEDPVIKCPDCDVPMVKAVLPCNFQIRGFSPRNRRRQLEERYRKREQRDEWKNMSPKHKDWAARIAKKYGSSPWLTSPEETKRAREKKKGVSNFKRAQERQVEGIKGVGSAEFTDG